MDKLSSLIFDLSHRERKIVESLTQAIRCYGKSIVLFLAVNFSGANVLFSQTSSETETNLVETKNHISGSLMKTAPGLGFGISYERMFYNRVKIEIGMGLAGPWLAEFGYGIGSTVYPLKKATVNEINFYTGFRYIQQKQSSNWPPRSNETSYIPIGFNFIIESAAFVSIDVGPAVSLYEKEGKLFGVIDESKSEYFTFWNAKLGVIF